MKSNFKYLLITVLLISMSAIGVAQPGDAKREKIDALRAAFIAKKVNFSTQEAQAFWPLYNEMNDKQDANRRTFRSRYNANTNYNFATDMEAEAYLNAEQQLKQKEYEIYKEYYDKFKKVLPIKKVAAVRRADEDFKKEIIKSIKEN